MKIVPTGFKILFWITIFCLLFFVAGRFIPIYFINPDIRYYYHLALLILAIITVVTGCFQNVYDPQKNNRVSASLYALLFGGLAFIIFGSIFYVSLKDVQLDVRVLYINKRDTSIKIMRRRVNPPAFESGLRAITNENTLLKPFTSFMKIETSFDTTQLKKEEWIKKFGNISDGG